MTTIISPATYQVTVGTVSAQAIPPNPNRQGIYVFNPSASVTIWICPVTGPQSPGAPGGLPTAAAINGAGSIPVQPLQGIPLLPPNGTPPFTNGLNAICATPGTPLTIWEYYQ